MLKIIFDVFAVIAVMFMFCSFNITVEYQKKNDTLNYSDMLSSYSRKRIRIFINDSSHVSFGQIKSNEEIRQSASAIFTQKNDPLVLVLGHYQLQLGSGLLCGKKSYSSSDLFTQTFSGINKKIVHPLVSGNNLYSFMGVYLSYNLPFDFGSLKFSFFYSYLDLFLPYENEKTGIVHYALHQLFGKVFNDKKINENYVLHNGGFLCSVNVGENIVLQGYFLHSFLKSTSGKKYSWDDFFKHNENVSFYYGAGLMFYYSEKNLYFFADAVITDSIGENISILKSENGFGFSSVLSYKDDIIIFLASLKYCSNIFYAPYSSEKVYGENYYKLLFMYKYKKLYHIGGAITVGDYLKYNGDEKLYYSVYSLQNSLIFKYSKSDLTFSLLEKTALYKYKIKAKTAFKKKYLSMALQGIMQWCALSDLSWLLGINLKMIFFENVSLALCYYYGFISENNSLYASLITDIKSIAYGEFIYKTSHLAALQIKVTYKKNIIFGNYKISYSINQWDHQFSYGILLYL